MSNVRGVCTAVFRRAENGPDRVAFINELFGGGDKVEVIEVEILFKTK